MSILFAKNLVLQRERGDLLRDPFWENPFMKQVYSKYFHLKTERISTLNRHIGEQSDPLSCMTGLMCQTVFKHVPLMKAKRSTLKMQYFVKERKVPLRMSHESVMVNEADMDFPNSRTATYRCEARADYQRSRIDLQN